MTALIHDHRFLLYTLALMASLLVIQGVIAHRVARFDESGFPLATIAFWAAVASAMSLPGRWVAPRLAERLGATRVQAATALVVAASVALMVDGTSQAGMATHFFLFGLAFGAMVPLRAMVMSQWFSGPGYGSIMGAQWTATILIGATGPLLIGVIRDTSGGYSASFAVFSAVLFGAAMAMVASGRARPGTPIAGDSRTGHPSS